MCPICLSTMGWIALGGGTGSSAIAGLILALKRRKQKDEDGE